MKLQILILSLFLALLSGCVTQRKCNLKFPPSVQRDSIYVETVKEIPVLIPGDTINLEIPINCPDQDIVFVENFKLRQQIRILNGKLVSNTLIKPDTVFVHTKETITKTKEVKVLQPVKFIPKFFKFCTWGFVFIILLIIGYFVIKYRLKLLSLIRK